MFTGFYEFSTATELAERVLFGEVSGLVQSLAENDKAIILTRAILPAFFLSNPYDLRGRRKLNLILELLEVGKHFI